jgi:nitrite reductase/ring-hydroxylating ferredoxin subunit
MAEFVTVGKLSDLAAGSGKVVDVNGKAVALFNVGGTIYAIDNTCRHRGGPLGEGSLDGNVVTCPWHMWEYDVTTGEFTANREIKVASYAVQVEGDEIKVAV